MKTKMWFQISLFLIVFLFSCNCAFSYRPIGEGLNSPTQDEVVCCPLINSGCRDFTPRDPRNIRNECSGLICYDPSSPPQVYKCCEGVTRCGTSNTCCSPSDCAIRMQGGGVCCSSLRNDRQNWVNSNGLCCLTGYFGCRDSNLCCPDGTTCCGTSNCCRPNESCRNGQCRGPFDFSDLGQTNTGSDEASGGDATGRVGVPSSD